MNSKIAILLFAVIFATSFIKGAESGKTAAAKSNRVARTIDASTVISAGLKLAIGNLKVGVTACITACGVFTIAISVSVTAKNTCGPIIVFLETLFKAINVALDSILDVVIDVVVGVLQFVIATLRCLVKNLVILLIEIGETLGPIVGAAVKVLLIPFNALDALCDAVEKEIGLLQ